MRRDERFLKSEDTRVVLVSKQIPLPFAAHPPPGLGSVGYRASLFQPTAKKLRAPLHSPLSLWREGGDGGRRVPQAYNGGDGETPKRSR